MSGIFTYSPREVQLIVAGYKVSGWETITITRSIDGFIPVRGIRGKNTRVRSTDTSATITVPVMQTELSNEVLNSIHTQDLQLGSGRLEITLKDGIGTSGFSSNEAYIIGYPAVTYSGGIEYREWRIFCQTTATFEVGSNIESGIGDILSSGFSAAKDAVGAATEAVGGLFG